MSLPGGKFTPAQVIRILAVTCDPPEKTDRPITHWTSPEIADEVTTRGIVESIAPARVGRSLRETALPPLTSRSWLNTPRRRIRLQFQDQVETVRACSEAAHTPHGKIIPEFSQSGLNPGGPCGNLMWSRVASLAIRLHHVMCPHFRTIEREHSAMGDKAPKDKAKKKKIDEKKKAESANSASAEKAAKK